MSSANKITFVYTVHGANLYAFTASGTYGVVDYCKVVNNLNSSIGAGLFAFHTADTAVGALLACDSALFMI